MKIMFCHDTSEVAQKALDQALEYFSCQKPEVILVTVIEDPLDASLVNEEIYDRLTKEIREKQHKIAEEISSKGFEVDALIATGDPRSMIMEAVEKTSPDVVVIGKRGSGSVKEIVLGSVSAYVIRHLSVPVMVMPV